MFKGDWSAELTQGVSPMRMTHKLSEVKSTLYVHGCELSDEVLEDKRQRYPGNGVGCHACAACDLASSISCMRGNPNVRLFSIPCIPVHSGSHFSYSIAIRT